MQRRCIYLETDNSFYETFVDTWDGNPSGRIKSNEVYHVKVFPGGRDKLHN